MQLTLFVTIRTILNTAYRMAYPFLGVFARALGVDLATMSFALSLRSLSGGIVPFIISSADKRGRKFSLVLGVGIFTLSVALVVFFPTFPVLLASMFFTSLAKYIFDPAMQAYLADSTPYEKRGRIIAITELGWSLAFIIGVPLVGFLIARAGWISPFALLAILGFLTLILLIFLIPNDGTRVGTRDSLRQNFRLVFNSLPAKVGLTVTLLSIMGNEIINLIFGVWLEDSFGLQIAALGASAAIIGASELGGEGLVAFFSDKLGKERAVGFGLMINTLAALLLPIIGKTTFGALLGLFLFYISFEFTFVSILPMMTEIMPKARATLMAFNVTAFSLGRALGAPLATFLYQFGFPVVVTGTILFNIFALFALLKLKQYKSPPSTL
ncbi:MAG TPA: MFS transporter [Anaerolineales bacterium]|nr:MFS transporter [Anaerolineales bacterium]